MNRCAVEYDDALLAALATTPEAFEEEARFLLAPKLFDLGRLSSGQAARLAPMGRVAFLLKLEKEGWGFGLNLTADDLEDDFRDARPR